MPAHGPDVHLDAPAYIHDSAQLYGKVSIGRGASVWPFVVMRAEMHAIRIGAHTNVQDFVMIHVGGTTPTVIGDHCSVTHHCTIHGCAIGDNCLIGINATIMDGCEIGANSIVAGGAFLKENTRIPANSVVMGLPAKVVRTRNNWIANRMNAFMYERNAEAYVAGNYRVWSDAGLADAMQGYLRTLEAEFAQRFPTERATG
ncbi:MAG: gamma carbonic anhydrase family protein [Alphaproteobacteria bacterium]|nr:gamma carbonic anhydrase family protein [Alphaproteobacteria bacterium]